MASTFLIAPGTATAAAVRCEGRLNFGQIVSCPSITGPAQHVYSVVTTVDGDTLFTTLTRPPDGLLGGAITDSGGNLVCPLTSDAGSCQLGPAGTYTVTVSLTIGDGGAYSAYFVAPDVKPL